MAIDLNNIKAEIDLVRQWLRIKFDRGEGPATIRAINEKGDIHIHISWATKFAHGEYDDPGYPRIRYLQEWAANEGK